MSLRLKVLCIVIGIGILVVIVELIRRRKLREEYSVLWFLLGVTVLALSLSLDLLLVISRIVGAAYPPSTVFFFAILFLFLISLHYSVKISGLTMQVKNLAQQVALLQASKEKAADENPPLQPSG